MLFSVFPRVWKPPSRIAYRAPEPRYLDLLVSSHRAMSFKCRARALERRQRRLPVGGDRPAGKIAGTSYTNRRDARLRTSRRPGVDQDGFMLIPDVRINARMSVHNVQINGNKLRLGGGERGGENDAIFQGVNERRRSPLNKNVYRASPSGIGF